MVIRTIYQWLVITTVALTWSLVESPSISADEDQPPLSAFLDQLDQTPEVDDTDENDLALPVDIPRCQRHNLIYWLELSPKATHFISHCPNSSRDPPQYCH
jgi:hypothetical protein